MDELACVCHLCLCANAHTARDTGGDGCEISRYSPDFVCQRTDRSPSLAHARTPINHRVNIMKTDSQLQSDVREELKWEPQVTASQIGVQVKDGVVTLSGEVSSFAEKWNAESAAQRVSGVNALAVDLKVKLSELGGRSDADIARSAENVLSWSTTVPQSSVKVMVENGFITLTGDVDWQFQRLAAAASVRFLQGVTGVSDQIAIKPTLRVSAVRGDIETALKRTAVADAKNIHVEVDGSDVTLTGKVQSWAERETATTSAWGTPGVRSVIDKMTLAY